jgi:cobalt-precorrin 5A hydrolase / precorrin-3B C17-methyltransferase
MNVEPLIAPIAVIAITETSAQRLQVLCQAVEIDLWVPDTLDIPGARTYSGSLKDCIAQLWPTHRALVFALATGAVVRLIAPLLTHKSIDPAVVVLDEAGQFVVSLCGGHQGGGDRLTQQLALQLGATPVLTGASAALGIPAIDLLGTPFGWARGTGDWTGVSAAIVRGEAVEVMQDAGSTLWQQQFDWVESDPREPTVEAGLYIAGRTLQPSSPQPPAARIWISVTQRRFAEAVSLPHPLPKVQWHPRVLWVGVGCERGTSEAAIESAIAGVFQAQHLAQEAIAGIASIDLKADEVGLLAACQTRNLSLQTFTAEQLKSILVPNPSPAVEQEVGTPSVAEAAALLAAGEGGGLLAPKQIYKPEDQAGAVTVAVAIAPVEYTGRTGKLWLVGTGPGQLQQMTVAAQTAIAAADVVIGYSLYLDLVAPLLRPEQIIEASPITQERQRAKRAIELAQWGLTVAVISSGDCGIYGMGGLVFEGLKDRNWDGKTPEVQVFPGVSALQSAASRVGAPLMHDFCAISLSDLLTPWALIEKRLIAAAAADFVVALYNPKSQNRVEQIAIAQRIFLEHRHPDNPVALVRSAYRDDERITLTTLATFLECEVDMLTVVLIGNSYTDVFAGWMITPRSIQSPVR